MNGRTEHKARDKGGENTPALYVVDGISYASSWWLVGWLGLVFSLRLRGDGDGDGDLALAGGRERERYGGRVRYGGRSGRVREIWRERKIWREG
jgi:hypothetical protein